MVNQRLPAGIAKDLKVSGKRVVCIASEGLKQGCVQLASRRVRRRPIDQLQRLKPRHVMADVGDICSGRNLRLVERGRRINVRCVQKQASRGRIGRVMIGIRSE